MKKIFTFITCLLSGMAAMAENAIQISPIVVESAVADQDGYTDLIIMNDGECATIGFELVFPEGMSPYVNSKGNLVSTSVQKINDRLIYTYYDEDEEDDVTANAFATVEPSVKEVDGLKVLKVGTMGSSAIDGNSGAVLKIRYKFTKDMAPGIYPIYLKNANYADRNGENAVPFTCVSSYVKVGNPSAAEVAFVGTVPSFVSEALTTDASNVSVDMSAVTGGILNLSDSYGISEIPSSATFDKVSYTRSTLAAKYGTICVPFDLASDSKVQYYTISEAAAGQITISKVASVPAGTPAIYENLGGGSISYTGNNVTLAAAGVDGAGAELVGTYAKTKVTDANTYYLKDGKFNRINGSFNSGAFKAYAKSGSALAKALEIFVDDADPTAINGASTSASIEGIYNAAGAQNKKLEKGVNILKMSDGSVKKVLVK